MPAQLLDYSTTKKCSTTSASAGTIVDSNRPIEMDHPCLSPTSVSPKHSKPLDNTSATSNLPDSKATSSAELLLEFNTSTSKICAMNVFGPGPDLFDRPTSICVNARLGHIIAADKDNHRIQLFDYYYQLIVSDAHNRRVPLPTVFGSFRTSFG